jgi:hypothetical protein
MILQIILFASKVKKIVKKKWPLSTHGSFFLPGNYEEQILHLLLNMDVSALL